MPRRARSSSASPSAARRVRRLIFAWASWPSGSTTRGRRGSISSGREVDRGIRALRRCLELRAPEGDDLPSHAYMHRRLGNLLAKKGDFVAAEAEYAAAQREHPDFRAQKIVLRN